jgi:hypothetical protein
MKRLLSTLLLVSPLALTGCVIAVDGASDHYNRDSWEVKQDNNRTIISQLQLGATLETVKNKLGTPDFYETSNSEGGQNQVLFYRTHRTESDSKTTKDECHYLKFNKGLLVSIGNGSRSDRHL